MRAEDQRLLDQLNNNTPAGMDVQARAESLRKLNIAAEVDTRVIEALEKMNRSQQTSVVARLGHVLGWTGNTIAALFLAAGCYAQFQRGVSVPFPYVPNAFEAPYLAHTLPEIVLGVLALITFLIGRALRYIFAGK